MTTEGEQHRPHLIMVRPLISTNQTILEEMQQHAPVDWYFRVWHVVSNC